MMLTYHKDIGKKHLTLILLKMHKSKLEYKFQKDNYYLRLGFLSVVIGYRERPLLEVVN